MLRDFGIVTLIDLSASLVGVLVALPAALLIAEPGERRGGNHPPGVRADSAPLVRARDEPA